MKQFTVPNIITFSSWDNIPKLYDFVYPWRNEKAPNTTFRAYHDNNFLYFKFVASGSKPHVYVESNNKLEVSNSERVEIFFRRDECMKPYYCLEIDPCGRVLDYKANLYRDFDRSWQWPESLSIKTEIEDKFYSVEGKVSFSVLKKLELIKNDKIEIGLYRGHCTGINDKKASINWISWVDSKTEKPDFHVPSSFGLFVFEN